MSESLGLFVWKSMLIRDLGRRGGFGVMTGPINRERVSRLTRLLCLE